MKNLHLIFLVTGILYGFLIFAKGSAVDPIAGILAYIFFYLPAFFGGIYSGNDRAEESNFLDSATDTIDTMFKINLKHMTDSPNHFIALALTLFYFAFWTILASVHDILIVGFIFKWVLPIMILGFLSNQDSIEYVKPLVLKLMKFFKAVQFFIRTLASDIFKQIRKL